MTTLATETWTGTNGVAWPAQWTAVGGTSSIQANRGRLVTPAVASGSYGTAIRHLSGLADTTDTDVTVTIYPTTTAFQYTFVRLCGSGTAGQAWQPLAGYQLWLIPSGGNVNCEVRKYVGGTESTLIAATTPAVPWSTTSGFTVRFQRTGSTVRWKLWAGNGTEPAAWTATVTDATPAGAGKVAVLTTNNGDGVATTVDWDNLTVTDGAVGASTNVRLGTAAPGFRVGTATPAALYAGATRVWP